MATHILGNTTAPSAGANDTTYNEIGPTGFTPIPANGYVTALYGYFGSTSGGAMACNLLLVNSAGTLLATAGSTTVYGAAWQSASIAPYYLASGTQIGVAWYVTAEVHFPVYSSSHFQAESVGGPSNLNGFQPGSPYYQGGTGYYLVWVDPCTLSGVSPSTATAGQSVTLTGAGFTGGSISSVTFNGISASYTVNSDTQITATVPHGYTTGNIQVNTDHGSPTIAFTEGAPTIASYSPTSAISGSTVTITGSGFTDGTVTGVSFNSIAASSYNVVSNTKLTAVVPNGATTGTLQVSTNHGNATTSFTEGPPTIASISPSNATPGQTVTITGYGFTDGTVTGVTFTPVGNVPLTASYTIVSNTSMTAVVPNGSVGSDVVTVNTDHGSATGNLQVTGTRAYDGSAIQNATPYVFDGANPQPATAIYIFDGTTLQQGI